MWCIIDKTCLMVITWSNEWSKWNSLTYEIMDYRCVLVIYLVDKDIPRCKVDWYQKLYLVLKNNRAHAT